MVRGSQRAKYALSLRIAMTEDTPVKHFLIQVNQQSELIGPLGRPLCQSQWVVCHQGCILPLSMHTIQLVGQASFGRFPISDLCSSVLCVEKYVIEKNSQFTSDAEFLTIQGSNLPFITIYDLLAYFCFHQRYVLFLRPGCM